MKVTAPPIAAAVSLDRGRIALYADLFKARLTLLVLLTTMVGFYAGTRGPVGYGLMLAAVFGMALVAGGGAALNQLWERRFDALMRRTQDRPLPSGRMQPRTVLRIGCAMSCLGVIWLALAVNLTTALLGVASLVLYLFLYTPLKRVTWLNTMVGAIPGAIPPLMGWTAATGRVTAGGLALFAILVFWQLPHFMAIAWLYREEYRRAGFRMLPAVEPDGRRTGRQAVLHAALLLFVSVLPFLFQVAGVVYLSGAIALGLAFLAFALGFARTLNPARARQLFFMSIVYLPVMLILLVIDKAT